MLAWVLTPFVLLEAASVDSTDPAMDTVNTDLVGAEQDYGTISFMCGQCSSIIA